MDMIDLAHAIANALESLPEKIAVAEAERDAMLIPNLPQGLSKAERRVMLEECSDRHDRLAFVVSEGYRLMDALKVAKRQIGTPESWQGDYIAPAPGWRVIASVEGTVMRAERYGTASH